LRHAGGEHLIFLQGHGGLVERASRPFAPNQKLTGGTPVPLALQETEMRQWLSLWN